MATYNQNLAVPQTGTGHITKGTSNGEYIAPVIAVMNADASGTYGVLQRAKVTITNIDEVFSYILSEDQSVALMNLFRVADADKSGQVNTLDSSANVDVSLNLAGLEVDDFCAMIRTALSGALSSRVSLKVNGGTSASDSTYRTPEKYLEYQAYQDALQALKYDTLDNMLAADDFASFSMTLDPCGGAISLVDKLKKAEEAIRKTLYTQLPESNTNKYLAPSGATDLSNGVFAAENISAIKFLPFVVGDKIVFVFDTTVGQAAAGVDPGTLAAPSLGPAISRVNGDGALAPSNTQAAATGAGAQVVGAFGGDLTAAGYAGSLTFSAPTRRRIALSLMISREAAAKGDNEPLASTLGLSGEGLVMEFVPETAVDAAVDRFRIDPAVHAKFEKMLATGMLNNLKAELVVHKNDIPAANVTATVGLPAAADVSDIKIDISQGSIENGDNWQVVAHCDALIGANDHVVGHYGRFAFIPDNANRANEFKIVRVGAAGNTWELQVNAMIADKLSRGKLLYIENSGLELEVAVGVTAKWSA